MNLENSDDLSKFEKIYLIDKDIKVNYLKKKINNKKKTLLIFFHHIPEDYTNYLIKNDKVQSVIFSWSIFNSKFNSRSIADKIVVDNIDVFFDEIKKKNYYFFNIFKKIYKNSNIEIAFKKNIAEQLEYYFRLLTVSNLIYGFNNNITVIVNSNKHPVINDLSHLEIFRNINYFKSKVIYYKKKFLNFNLFKNNFLIILYPFYILSNIRKIIFHKIEKVLAIRIYKQGAGFDDEKDNLNWIIDNDKFTTKNSLFIFEDSVNTQHLQAINKKNYNYDFCSYRKPCTHSSPFFLFKIFFIFIPLSFIFSIIILFAKKYLKSEYTKAWLKYLIWSNFTSVYSIKSYLAYHHYNSDHIYRNILLSNKKCLTSMFKKTHSENIFDYKNKQDYASIIFLNLFYDLEFHWSKCSIEMSDSNKSLSKKKVICGPVYFPKKKENINLSKLQKNKLIITFFTSSFGTYDAITSIEGHKKFLMFIQEIIKKHKNYQILFKPKYSLDHYKNNSLTKSIINELLKEDRFLYLDNHLDSNQIINISDLVISTAFSSTGLEAIYANKKAFFLDPLNNYRNSYFDKFHNFVCHSNEDAHINLNYWVELNNDKVLEKQKKIIEDLNIPFKDKFDFIIKEKINEKIKN